MKIVILDRDGVINDDGCGAVFTPEQFVPIAGSLEAIAKLNRAGYLVVIATNQSIISKKIITITDLQAIHARMQELLSAHNAKIDQIFFCPHQTADNCNCRKPKPGMLLDIEKHYNIDFYQENVPFVGDSTRDLLAGVSANCKPILVKTGHGQRTIKELLNIHIKNLLIFNDLHDFVEYWLS